MKYRLYTYQSTEDPTATAGSPPPVDAPAPDQSAPSTTLDPPTPATVDATPVVDPTPTAMVEVLSLLRDLQATLKTPAIAPTPVDTPATVDASPVKDDRTLALEGMLRELTLTTFNVPQELREFIPQDPIEAKKMLTSDAYKKLTEKMSFVPTAPAIPDAPAVKGDATKPPSTAKPKTFGDISNLSSHIADLMKGV